MRAHLVSIALKVQSVAFSQLVKPAVREDDMRFLHEEDFRMKGVVVYGRTTLPELSKMDILLARNFSIGPMHSQRLTNHCSARRHEGFKVFAFQTKRRLSHAWER